MSLKNIKKTSIFNIFLKNHTKISCLVPVLISLRKPKKKFKKVFVSYLVPVLLVEKGPKKIQTKRQNEFSTRYRVQNFFLFVDSVAGVEYGG